MIGLVEAQHGPAEPATLEVERLFALYERRIVAGFLEPLDRIQPVALRDRAPARRRRQWLPIALVTAALIAAVIVVVVRRPVTAPTPTPAATTSAPRPVARPVLVTVTALGI